MWPKKKESVDVTGMTQESQDQVIILQFNALMARHRDGDADATEALQEPNRDAIDAYARRFGAHVVPIFAVRPARRKAA